MDLEKDWELIPDEGFLEINDDGAGKKIYSRRYHPTMFSGPSATAVFQMNDYFICPSPSSKSEFIQLPKQPPVLIHSEPHMVPHDQTLVKSSGEVLAADHDDHQLHKDPAAVSQVFFKKTTKEITESVDTIKVSSSSWTSVAHEIEGGATNLQFEEEAAAAATDLPLELVDSDDGEGEGPLINNIWRWSLTGVGAICSFGVAAAATLCVVILNSSSSKNTSSHHQKLQFQIYSNKGMKEVSRPCRPRYETIAAVVRGSTVPITTARITFGGYYDASL